VSNGGKVVLFILFLLIENGVKVEHKVIMIELVFILLKLNVVLFLFDLNLLCHVLLGILLEVLNVYLDKVILEDGFVFIGDIL